MNLPSNHLHWIRFVLKLILMFIIQYRTIETIILLTMLKIKSQLERQKDIQYHTGSVLVKRCTVLLKGKKRNESDMYEKTYRGSPFSTVSLSTCLDNSKYTGYNIWRSVVMSPSRAGSSHSWSWRIFSLAQLVPFFSSARNKKIGWKRAKISFLKKF